MGRFWLQQVRPLLVVWLLFTVPVVCHHPTAEFVLGSLVGYLTAGGHHAPIGPGHLGHHHAHGGPAAEPVGAPAEPASAAWASAADGRLAWCAHHPAERARFLPEGQGGVALLSPSAALDVPAWVAGSSPLPERPPGVALAPPAPPPRSLV
jgi:hypothetical protein